MAKYRRKAPVAVHSVSTRFCLRDSPLLVFPLERKMRDPPFPHGLYGRRLDIGKMHWVAGNRELVEVEDRTVRRGRFADSRTILVPVFEPPCEQPGVRPSSAESKRGLITVIEHSSSSPIAP